MLEDRQLIRGAKTPGKRPAGKRLRPRPTALEARKTSLMKLLEMEHGKSIEELLLDDTVTTVAKFLRINKGTVSKWRMRLSLDIDYDIPSCNSCTKATVICIQGSCQKLLDAQNWNGLELKQYRLSLGIRD